MRSINNSDFFFDDKTGSNQLLVPKHWHGYLSLVPVARFCGDPFLKSCNWSYRMVSQKLWRATKCNVVHDLVQFSEKNGPCMKWVALPMINTEFRSNIFKYALCLTHSAMLAPTSYLACICLHSRFHSSVPSQELSTKTPVLQVYIIHF